MRLKVLGVVFLGLLGGFAQAHAANVSVAATSSPSCLPHRLVVTRGDQAVALARRGGIDGRRFANWWRTAEPAQRKLLSALHAGDTVVLCVGADAALADVQLEPRASHHGDATPLDAGAAAASLAQVVGGVVAGAALARGAKPVAGDDDDAPSLRTIELPAGSPLRSALRQRLGNPRLVTAVLDYLQSHWRLGARLPVDASLSLALDADAHDHRDALVYLELERHGQRQRLYHYIDADGRHYVLGHRGQGLRLLALGQPVACYSRISSGWGWRTQPVLGGREFHHGIDYAAPSGTPVLAAMDGVVDMSSWHGNYGRLVEIRHPDGVATRYGHLQAFAKGMQVGSRVRRGQVIGYVGRSGLSTGPHLYFEIWEAGQRVNPTQPALTVDASLGASDRRQFAAYLRRLDS